MRPRKDPCGMDDCYGQSGRPAFNGLKRWVAKKILTISMKGETTRHGGVTLVSCDERADERSLPSISTGCDNWTKKPSEARSSLRHWVQWL
jgi:hypothetical protein